MSKRDRRLQKQQSLAITHTGVAFSGPLPPPSVLRGYNEIVPGAAERILAMAEAQAEHRRALERTVVDGNTRAQGRGQWMAFSLSLLVVGIGAVLLWYDKAAAGLGTIVAALAALVAVFITAKTAGARERQRKRRDLDSARTPAN